MEAPLYNQVGEKVGNISLPENTFGAQWNSDLVHQVITSMMSNMRHPIAHSKGRGEVSGGGKKPWKQKGTGRARHGSIRSPIWRGGGVTHGPTKERNYAKTIPRAMKQKALSVILSRKLRDGGVLFLDSLSVKEPKTKEAQKILGALSRIDQMEHVVYKNGRRALFLLPRKDALAERSFRNIPSVRVEEARNMNPLDAVMYQSLVFVSYGQKS